MRFIPGQRPKPPWSNPAARPKPATPRGRPRNAETDAKLIEVTVNLLAEVGYERLTIEAVAARAGVSRPSVYRRWLTKEALVVAVLNERLGSPVDIDRGDARPELHHAMESLNERLGYTGLGPVVFSLHAAAASSADIAEPLRLDILCRQTAVLAQILQRGIERGQLRADLTSELLRDLLFGPPVCHLLFTGKPMDCQQVETAMELLWPLLRR